MGCISSSSGVRHCTCTPSTGRLHSRCTWTYTGRWTVRCGAFALSIIVPGDLTNDVFRFTGGDGDSTSTRRDGKRYARCGSTTASRRLSHANWRARLTAVDGRCCERVFQGEAFSQGALSCLLFSFAHVYVETQFDLIVARSCCKSVWSLCIGLRNSEQKTIQHGRVISDYVEFYRRRETGSSSHF